jgi:hypothetical protein
MFEIKSKCRLIFKKAAYRKIMPVIITETV